MSRGNLNWLITVTADGALPLDGVAPVLIQWLVKTHPAEAMRDSGCRLIRLELHGPEVERARALLRSIGYCGDDVELRQSPVGAPVHLVATLHTPEGIAELSSE